MRRGFQTPSSSHRRGCECYGQQFEPPLIHKLYIGFNPHYTIHLGTLQSTNWIHHMVDYPNNIDYSFKPNYASDHFYLVTPTMKGSKWPLFYIAKIPHILLINKSLFAL
jgi:hypothetical protein